MSVTKGEAIGIYTGGWFSSNGGPNGGTLDIFTGGWFEGTAGITVLVSTIDLSVTIPIPQINFDYEVQMERVFLGAGIFAPGIIEGEGVSAFAGPLNLNTILNAPVIISDANITPDPLSASFTILNPLLFQDVSAFAETVQMSISAVPDGFRFIYSEQNDNVVIYNYEDILNETVVAQGLSAIPFTFSLSAVLPQVSAFIDEGIHHDQGVGIIVDSPEIEGVTIALFGDFFADDFSMGDGGEMNNEWITKCGISNYRNERILFDNVVTEAINQHGVCMDYYITTWDKTYDPIWGEDNDRRFQRKFEFMGFYNLPREEKMWSKFGIQGMDNFSIYVSKLHFQEASTFGQSAVAGNEGHCTYPDYIPKVGDIIMADYNKYIYEVTEVKEEVGMFLLSKQHVWELVVRPFKDEHIALSATTSASMDYIADYTNKDTDVFDVSETIEDKKDEVNYDPCDNEEDSQDPFGGW